MVLVTVMEIQMQAEDAAKLVLQVVITPVVQLLQMMIAAYVVVITAPVLTVLAYQMVILL